MSDYLAKSDDLIAVADAIRTKGGTEAPLTFPDGFVAAIENLSAAEEDRDEYPTIEAGTLERRVREEDFSGEVIYPKKEGKVFAGWFTDGAFGTPADFSAGSDWTVYGKYVSADYLSPKFGTTVTKNVVTSIKALYAAPDTSFIAKGYICAIGGVETVLAVDTFSTSYSGKSVKSIFGGGVTGGKFVIGTLSTTGFADGVEITMTPYWTTPDGTTVYGAAKTLIYHPDSVELKGVNG